MVEPEVNKIGDRRLEVGSRAHHRKRNGGPNFKLSPILTWALGIHRTVSSFQKLKRPMSGGSRPRLKREECQTVDGCSLFFSIVGNTCPPYLAISSSSLSLHLARTTLQSRSVYLVPGRVLGPFPFLNTMWAQTLMETAVTDRKGISLVSQTISI